MGNQAIGDYLKTKAKSSGDFVSIYIPSAYHTLDVLTHFFYQKKHEWIAVCFLDKYYQCHAIWLEKGIDVNSANSSLSITMAIKFAKLNNIKNIILAHNHTITSEDISCFRSHGININSAINIKRQQFLKFSEGDKVYSNLWLKACENAEFGFVSSVIVGGEFHIEGHQSILNNIAANKPIFRGFRSKANNPNDFVSAQKIGFKKLIYKSEVRKYKLSVYKGLIGYYGLSDWWNDNFTLEEQHYIARNFNKVYNKVNDFDDIDIIRNRKLNDLSDCLLTEAEIEFWSDLSLQFATSLIIGFNNKKNREISLKILEKAEELIDNSISVLDLHFFFLKKIGIYFSLRDLNEKFQENIIKACEQQIEISHKASSAFRNIGSDGFIPSHTGYKRLAIIKEKEKKYAEVIALCQKAQGEGWNGDWQKRIERCKKKLSKL